MQLYQTAPWLGFARRLAIACLALPLTLVFSQHARAGEGPRDTDWSSGKPPRGWSEDAYSPNSGASPNFEDDYRGPTGADYDAREDPYHPLKNPNKDPGKQWEGSSGSGKNVNFVAHGVADWPWGERYYDAVFAAPLIIHNKCKTPQQVGIFVYDNPYLTMPPRVTAQPGDTTVTGQVQLPPEPPGPLHSGEGWIDFGPIIIPPGMFPPPQLHQPNFEEIEGEVVVWHAWSPAGDCNAVRETYTIGGHIHFRPPPPDGGGGPERLAQQDMCEFYWLIGTPPAQLGDKDCTEEMRALALHFVEKIIGPYVLNAPEDWLWLPDAAAIAQMSIGELLAMKAHAEAVMGVGPGAVAAASGQPPADAPRAAVGAIGGPPPSQDMRIQQGPTSDGNAPANWSFDNGAKSAGFELNKDAGATDGTSPRVFQIEQRGGEDKDASGPPAIRRIDDGKGAPIASPIDGSKGNRIERSPNAGRK